MQVLLLRFWIKLASNFCNGKVRTLSLTILIIIFVFFSALGVFSIDVIAYVCFQNYIIGAFKPACNITVAFTDGKSRKQVCFIVYNFAELLKSLYSRPSEPNILRLP